VAWRGVVSTESRAHDDREARKAKLGGEVLCYVCSSLNFTSEFAMSRIGVIPLPAGQRHAECRRGPRHVKGPNAP